MGFRFQRRLTLGPGLRVNVSKSGVSTSAGRRGASFTLGPRGTRSTVGIPGSGLSYTEQSSSGTSGSRGGLLGTLRVDGAYGDRWFRRRAVFRIARRAMNDDELERWLVLYRACCEQSGVDPLPDDEARELARKFHDLLAPALEREFRLH